jgi:hypothetical protein
MSLMAQGVLFNLAKDLNLIYVVGYDQSGKSLTNGQRYANATWMFYLGNLSMSLFVNLGSESPLIQHKVFDANARSALPNC